MMIAIKKPVSIGKLALSVFLLFWAVIQIYPLIWLALFSLKDNAEIFGGNIAGFPKTPKWENYPDALKQGGVLIYFFNSLLVTGVTIVMTVLLSSTTAYAISRMKWKLSGKVMTFLLLGMMIPVHAALLPLFIVLSRLKLLNTYLALVLPYVAFALPLGVFILSGFLTGIPREMEESAAIDGAHIYRTFFSIIAPLIRPAIATVAIFTYLASWNELMFAVTFISRKEFSTLTVGIMSMVGSYVTRWGPIGAGLMIATIPTIIIYILLSKQVQKSMIAGAVKG
ncbi:MAG: carbohydrate ABC transporter permease [Spirochaetaceae bacterium]|jgi:raffinose/stachyose/melibiose transport system permease protein|nr:carbohydrate ABC transporter permease [Spirochaetaceae bacterium]